MQTFTVTQLDTNQRLDVYLAAVLSSSRAQAQKLIKAGAVTVNGKAQKAHYVIQTDDVITVTTIPLSSPPAETWHATSLPNLTTQIIIDETDDYLVIDKPAGLTVHGGEGITGPTLVDWLEQHYPEITKVGEDPLRPGIVHRLDREASGVMVIAKTHAMFEHLKGQFQNRTTKKVYTALVHGAIEIEHDELNFPIARSAKGYKMAAKPNNQQGRNAVTEFTVAQHFINYTLLTVTIKTGRTHQIRVHMSAYGHPIVGDDLYGTKKTRVLNERVHLGRIFLHATSFGFTDLNNAWHEYTSELPGELAAFLTIIK